MANIRVEIEDYLDEVSTEFLISEIKSRVNNSRTPKHEKKAIETAFYDRNNKTIRDEYYDEVFQKLKDKFSVAQLEQFLTA